MNTNVSAVIPAYNNETSLAKAIDSVLNQELKPYEVIVINDGSTDDTNDIAQSYGDQIIYIEQENKGQALARNAGLDVATGDYIAFLDADDYWKPKFLSKCVGFLNNNPSLVAVLTGWEMIVDEQNSKIVPPIMSKYDQAKPDPFVIRDFLDFWVEYDYVQTGAIMIRKSVIDIDELRMVDLRNSQDWEYWLMVSTYGQWGFIPEVLYINDSRRAAKGKWWSKYKERRKLCPTVEQWESRLVTKIAESDKDRFNIIRGRVAVGYAHDYILGGNSSKALHIVNKYASYFPSNKLSRLMTAGAKFGFLGWRIACGIIIIKERLKAMKW